MLTSKDRGDRYASPGVGVGGRVKLSDVKIGGTYLTYVGDSLAPVIVVRAVVARGWGGRTRTLREP